MKKSKRQFLLFLSFFILTHFSLSGSTFVLTIPKSGTHLVKKYFYLLKQRHPKTVIPAIDHTVSAYGATFPGNTHNLNPHLYQEVCLSENIKLIFVVRDIRDALLSMVFHVDKNFSLPHQEVDLYRESLTLEEKILYHIYYKVPFAEAIENLDYLRSMGYPQYLVKFEDLVGIEGGGSRVRQEQTIYGIAHFLDIELSTCDVQWIADRLFGKEHCPNEVSITFHSGQIKAWKTYFSQKHKELVIKAFGNFLIEYGYERDYNW